MEHLKADNKIITSPSGIEIPENFFDIYNKQSGKIALSSDFIRVEHPHCAFFKSVQKSDEKEYVRNTLYTPQGRLYLDEKEGEDEPLKYVYKKEQLEILLFYLRDVEIKPSLLKPDENVEVIIMPPTPLSEFLSYVKTNLFIEVMKDYEMEEKHIMSQFRRIFNEKLDVLLKKLSGKIKYAVFTDVNGIKLDDDFIDRWHFYYIRKSRLFK
jgi:hypothetical protein